MSSDSSIHPPYNLIMNSYIPAIEILVPHTSTLPSSPSSKLSWISDLRPDKSTIHSSISDPSIMDVSKLLQLQTQAAYGSRPRPQPQPVQHKYPSNRNSGTSMTSTSSQSSSTNNSASNCLEFVRCSRCHRTLSMDPTSSTPNGVVQFGTNLFYCSRCASMVGYKR